jgi:hypothetical protein
MSLPPVEVRRVLPNILVPAKRPTTTAEPSARVATLLAASWLDPAATCVDAGACVLLPSHTKPAVQAEHDVRVLAVPPAVDERAPHVLQLLAPGLLNVVSVPHAAHTEAWVPPLPV